MDRRQAVVLALVLLGVASVGLLAAGIGLAPDGPSEATADEATVSTDHGEHEDTESGAVETVPVTLYADGEQVGVVDAELAVTPEERYVGLSDHDSLAEGEGMLFVHDEQPELTYVMRGMAFGIDIVFVGSDCRVTTLHSAPAPGPDEDGEQQRYSGVGQYVLEVPKGYAADRIEPGDRIEIDGGCPG